MRLACTIALLSMTLIAAVRADDADDAMKLAAKLTTEGASTFDTKDAKAMAAYYTEDAQLTIVSKDKDTGALKTETRDGHAGIEAYYRELFKNAGAIRSKNHVEYARRLDPDVLVIGGVFYPDLTGDTFKVPFFQVRHQEGGKWRISSIQIFILPQN